ncbi:hypothetical protein [Acinetobacter sp. c3-l95]|uniref:hypothetical protein n=1 Tax=Acinetobacter sp. c3-l95 TaxID=3342804 RepID=UPI0035B959DB
MKLAHADKKPISYVIRFLMVDHQQSTFNQITDELQKQNHKAMGKLLDDFASFDKMLNLQWDVIVFSFGGSVYSVQLLQDVPMKFARLSSEFTEQLKDDEKLVDLQEKLDAFKELNAETQFLIQDLNDMSAFANAWNVDVRYLQGDYFQARQANFLDSTG